MSGKWEQKTEGDIPVDFWKWFHWRWRWGWLRSWGGFGCHRGIVRGWDYILLDGVQGSRTRCRCCCTHIPWIHAGKKIRYARPRSGIRMKWTGRAIMITGKTVTGTKLTLAFLERHSVPSKTWDNRTKTDVTLNGREKDFLAIPFRTYWHRSGFPCLAGHDRTFRAEVFFHSVIWVLTGTYCNRGIA